MTSPSLALDGRVALVTGASRRIGIGQAIVRRLVAQGASVLVHAWSPHDAEQPWGAEPDAAAALVAELREGGAEVDLVEADLGDPAAPNALVAAARSAFGRLDIVVANHARSAEQDLASVTAEELDRTFAVNVRATLLLVQAFAAGFPGPDGGRVVLFTSGQYHQAMPGELPYIASKAALNELTPSLAVELMPRGITVNCIDPGPTDTGCADDASRAALARRMPGGRWGEPDDAARLIGWLVSDEARWVTGRTIASDGGWSALG